MEKKYKNPFKMLHSSMRNSLKYDKDKPNNFGKMETFPPWFWCKSYVRPICWSKHNVYNVYPNL